MTTAPSRHFRLATVLRVAASREEQLSREMAVLQQAQRAEEARMALLRDLQTTTLDEERVARSNESVSAAWLAQAAAYADSLMDRIHEQMQRLESNIAGLEACRGDLVAASQRRQMLEKLQDQQRERWQEHLERIEVAEAAEVATNQYLQRQAEQTERQTEGETGRRGKREARR